MTNVIHRRPDCRGCGSRDLELVFQLQPSPVGDAFVAPDGLLEPQPSYPIDLFMCRDCGLAQLTDVIDPAILYGDYLYVTESSLGLAEHFGRYAEHVIRRCALPQGSLVIDLGSNDGTLLREFQQRGMRALGVEPASQIAALANETGVETVNAFFDAELAQRLVAEHGPARVITANNVFANIDDLGSWVRGIETLLATDGVFVFESYYLADLVRNMVFDFLYHEHLSAFSVKPIANLFSNVGLELVATERVPTKGGSLRYFVQRPRGPLANDGSVAKLRQEEEAMGLYDKATYQAFADRVEHLKRETVAFLADAKRRGATIAGFGASITGTTLIHHFEIGEFFDYLVDDNPAKQGRFSPGLHIPVLSSDVIHERKPDYVVALAWRYAEPFIQKHSAYIEGGGVFIVPVPEFRIVP